MTTTQATIQGMLDDYDMAMKQIAAEKGQVLPGTRPLQNIHHPNCWFVLSTLKEALKDYSLGSQVGFMDRICGNNAQNIAVAHRYIGDPDHSPVLESREPSFKLAPWVVALQNGIWDIQLPDIFANDNDAMLHQLLLDLNSFAKKVGGQQLDRLVQLQSGEEGRLLVAHNLDAVLNLPGCGCDGIEIVVPFDRVEACHLVFGLHDTTPTISRIAMRNYLRLIAVRINLGEIPQVFSD